MKPTANTTERNAGSQLGGELEFQGHISPEELEGLLKVNVWSDTTYRGMDSLLRLIRGQRRSNNHSTVDHAFEWATTPQGRVYWSQRDRDVQKISEADRVWLKKLYLIKSVMGA